MAWSQAPSPCRRRKRGRQNHPATASRRGSGRTPTGLETERRTPPATLADRFSICSPLEHNGNIWPAVNRSQAGPATTIGGRRSQREEPYLWNTIFGNRQCVHLYGATLGKYKAQP